MVKKLVDEGYEKFLKLDYEAQLVTALLLAVSIIEENKIKPSWAVALNIKMCQHLDKRMCATAERTKASDEVNREKT